MQIFIIFDSISNLFRKHKTSSKYSSIISCLPVILNLNTSLKRAKIFFIRHYGNNSILNLMTNYNLITLKIKHKRILINPPRLKFCGLFPFSWCISPYYFSKIGSDEHYRILMIHTIFPKFLLIPSV